MPSIRFGRTSMANPTEKYTAQVDRRYIQQTLEKIYSGNVHDRRVCVDVVQYLFLVYRAH